MPLPALQGAYLPHGRWACTVDDVEARFVTGQGPERASIWHDWLSALAVLKTLVGTVPAAWLSGSFLTDKPVPSDIDSVFVLDIADLESAYQRLSPDQWAVVQAFAGGHGARELLDLNVDSYILTWHPTPTPQRTSPEAYYRDRGYWDDLWVRVKDPQDARQEAVPRRGYVEVMVDGYR